VEHLDVPASQIERQDSARLLESARLFAGEQHPADRILSLRRIDFLRQDCPEGDCRDFLARAMRGTRRDLHRADGLTHRAGAARTRLGISLLLGRPELLGTDVELDFSQDLGVLQCLKELGGFAILDSQQGAILIGSDQPLRARAVSLQLLPCLKHFVDVPLAVADGNHLALRQFQGQLLGLPVALDPTIAFFFLDGPLLALRVDTKMLILADVDIRIQQAQRHPALRDRVEPVHVKPPAFLVVEWPDSLHLLHVGEVQFRGVLGDYHTLILRTALHHGLLMRGDQRGGRDRGAVQQTIGC